MESKENFKFFIYPVTFIYLSLLVVTAVNIIRATNVVNTFLILLFLISLIGFIFSIAFSARVKDKIVSYFLVTYGLLAILNGITLIIIGAI